MIHHLEFYTEGELTTIILRSAQVLGVEIDPEGARELARRSRGTPRLANRLLKRVRDFAQVKYQGRITGEVACLPWICWRWIKTVWIRPTGCCCGPL